MILMTVISFFNKKFELRNKVESEDMIGELSFLDYFAVIHVESLLSCKKIIFIGS